jgi:hypothetical protein
MLIRMTLAALLLGTVGTADAAVSCRSGQETLFKRGQTRVFSVQLRDGSGETIYACSARFRTPRHVGDLDYGGDPRFYAGPRFGRRVVLLRFEYSEGGDYGGELGWWDERSGTRRVGDLGTALIDRTAIAPDGALAAVYTDAFTEEGPTRVGLMCVGKRRLTKLREIATGDIAPRSLAITDDEVSWTTRAGDPVSMPRAC